MIRRSASAVPQKKTSNPESEQVQLKQVFGSSTAGQERQGNRSVARQAKKREDIEAEILNELSHIEVRPRSGSRQGDNDSVLSGLSQNLRERVEAKKQLLLQ